MRATGIKFETGLLPCGKAAARGGVNLPPM